MAKSKEPVNRLSALEAAKKAHQHEVGKGGVIYLDPDMSFVRAIALPSLGFMNMMGTNGLRDSSSILLDGEPGACKSTLALELFNWVRPYGGTGTYIDAENKGACDVAAGLLDDNHLYHPINKVQFLQCLSIDDIHRTVHNVVLQCRDANAKLPRNDQIPFVSIIDSVAGSPSEELMNYVLKETEGAVDRSHGTRSEALFWSIWSKIHNQEIAELPFFSVGINHFKKKVEQRGAYSVEGTYNPGGIAQNYHATYHFRCMKGKSFRSEALDGASYQEIHIGCEKNSRGPTGLRTTVRRYYKRGNEFAPTIFWWDWARNSVDFLASFGVNHAIHDVCSVKKNSEKECSCKQLGVKEEDPSVVGELIHRDEKLMSAIMKLFCWRQFKMYNVLTLEQYTEFRDQAVAARDANRKAAADDQS